MAAALRGQDGKPGREEEWQQWIVRLWASLVWRRYDKRGLPLQTASGRRPGRAQEARGPAAEYMETVFRMRQFILRQAM